MRKIIYGVGISLDGYIARPDGSVDFLFMPEDYSNADFFKSIDAVIMGRKTYDAALRMGGGFGKKTKTYVYSRTLREGEHKGVTIVSGSPEPHVKGLREQRGKDIWLMGGGDIARQFLEADLVDEVHLGVVPMLVGSGIPAFPAGFPQRHFELVSNRSFSRGLIELKYARVRA